MNLADKVSFLMKDFRMDAETRCFVSKSAATVIDFVNPETGKTTIFNRSLEFCRGKFPDAEEMNFNAFLDWKAAQQRTPIKWEETTENRYYEMLEILPPAIQREYGFLVGEPYDHDAGNGKPRYQAFRKTEEGYFVSSRPITINEFKDEFKTEHEKCKS